MPASGPGGAACDDIETAKDCRERMEKGMIKIVAKMRVKADQVEAFKAAAKELVEKSRAEEGNIFYSLNVSTEDPTLLAFIECWKDQQAIELHNRTEHFTGILPRLGQMCQEALPVDLFTEVEY